MRLARLSVLITVAVFSATPGFAADLSAQASQPNGDVAQLQPFTFTLTNDTQLYTYSGNRAYIYNVPVPKGRGTQVYAPVSLEASGDISSLVAFDTIIRSGYIFSNQSTPGFGGSISTAADTSITNQFTYSGFGNIVPYFAMTLNIPTGTSALFGSATRARLDSDIVPLDTFGQGLNVGPSIGVAVQIDPEWLATLGLGYTSNGSYTTDQFASGSNVVNPQPPGQKLAPGDNFYISPQLRYQSGALTVTSTNSVTFSGDTYIDGVKTFQSGYQVLTGLAGSYRWAPEWQSLFSGVYTHTARNKTSGQIVDGQAVGTVGVYGAEPSNSNSDLVKFDFEHDFIYGAFAVGPTFGFMYRDRNSYNPIDLSFNPAKTQVKVGARSEYIVSEKFKINFKVEHAWTREGSKPNDYLYDPVFGQTGVNGSISAIHNQSWLVSLGTAYTF